MSCEVTFIGKAVKFIKTFDAKIVKNITKVFCSILDHGKYLSIRQGINKNDNYHS